MAQQHRHGVVTVKDLVVLQAGRHGVQPVQPERHSDDGDEESEAQEQSNVECSWRQRGHNHAEQARPEQSAANPTNGIASATLRQPRGRKRCPLAQSNRECQSDRE